MHELSIAKSIIEIASEAVRDAGAAKAIAVHVRIGVLAGVAPKALTFSYEVAACGTPLEGSQLVVESSPLVLHCPTCNRDETISDISRLVCTACGTPTSDVRSGRELEVESVEVI